MKIEKFKKFRVKRDSLGEMVKKVEVKKILTKIDRINKTALKLHSLYKGKLEVSPKCRIENSDDFGIWYTPGVGAVSREIAKRPEKIFEYTNKGNFVAIVSDGTRVLGFGDIGPEAALPVMEGKALLFKYLGGVDAFPICLKEKGLDKFCQIVRALEPTFGGINLEDIESPKCFYILERLQKEMRIPVWHDDQQGVAVVIYAGLINALKIVGKKKEKVRISMIGAGAAMTATIKLLILAGFPPENMLVVDKKGILNKGRKDYKNDKWRWQICQLTNKEGRKGGIAEAMEDTDICLGLSAPGPGIIKPEWVASMKKDVILFACANSIPEIWPWEAKKAGVRIVATGRSDFPNQVNNSLVFPGIFRGVLDVRARKISDKMCLVAAEELAKCAQEKGISEEYILPKMEEWEVFPRLATAVGLEAIKEGIAEVKMTRKKLFEKVSKIIKRARKETKILIDQGVIQKIE